MNNTPLDPKRTSLDGYFEKVGGSVRSWKKRYFVINENFLYYFKSNDMKDQLGCLPLVDITVKTEAQSDNSGFYFKIHLPPSNMVTRTEYEFRSSTFSEREKWVDAIRQKTIYTVFQKPLSYGLKVNPSNISQPLAIPYFIPNAFQYIEDYCIKIEGIYRLNGSSIQIESYMNQINRNLPIDFTDPHSTTSLIKQYIRSLPDPLFMASNYEHLKKISSLDEEKQTPLISQVIRSLPISNYVLLHFLFSHLRRIIEHDSINMMNNKAISVCIGPSIIQAPEKSVNEAYDECRVQQSVCIHVFNHFFEIFTDNPFLVYSGNTISSFYKISNDISFQYPYMLSLKAGTIIQSVAEDPNGWKICTYDNKWGLIHESNLEPASDHISLLLSLGHQKNKWSLSEQFLETMKNKCPESVQIYQSLSSTLKELRDKASKVSH